MPPDWAVRWAVRASEGLPVICAYAARCFDASEVNLLHHFVNWVSHDLSEHFAENP